ncbi:MAG: tetratricopeptide repeat protein [Myxococcales bacterium]|nr:tetratricopeptide repeat protein [Myxococcales bacterium]MCB9712710.1 tetratricopeptide repeat protein [Myxococcales bacterium]
MDRVPLLRSMVQSRPDDPFPRYGLAMELRKQGQVEEAEQVFRALVADHPGYVPTYLMLGNLLVELGRPEAAAEVLDRGIEAAERAGDDHALGELKAARAELP